MAADINKGKYNKKERTFETRIRFIHDVFADLYPPEDIMAACIEYKLGLSFTRSEHEAEKHFWKLATEENVMDILKIIDKD